MSDERSIIVFEQVHQANQKFDYFLTGMIGALCGYVGQGYTATKAGLNSSTLELIAILLLVTSFALSLFRMRIVIQAKSNNAKALNAAEHREAINAALAKGGSFETLRNHSTGLEMTPEQAKERVKELTELEQNQIEKFTRHDKRAAVFRKWIMFLLSIGFLILIVSKVVKPYIDPVPPTAISKTVSACHKERLEVISGHRDTSPRFSFLMLFRTHRFTVGKGS